MQKQVDAKRVQLRQEADEILEAAAEPIDGPSHYYVESAPRGVLAQCIESGALITAFGATDTMILVHLDDLAPDAGRDFA
jgi:hypothetical protein